MGMVLKKFILLPAIFSHEMDINLFKMVRFVFVVDLRFLRHRKWGAVSLQHKSHSAVNKQRNHWSRWQSSKESWAKSFTCVCHGVQDLQSVGHAVGKQSGVFFAAKVEPPHLPGISPLVKVRRGLVVLETSHDGTVYNHLRVNQSRRLIIRSDHERIWNCVKLMKQLLLTFKHCFNLHF